MKAVSVLLLFLTMVTSASADEGARLDLTVKDEAGQIAPCRVHLKNEKGQPQRAPKLPFWRDHFVCPGRVVMELKPGEYSYQVERGPEFRGASGKLKIRGGKKTELIIALKQVSKLREAGWYSGDLHVHRPLSEIELLMQAEDLDFAPVITWWNNRNLWKQQAIPSDLTRKFDRHRIYNVMAGEDEREGGALLYFELESPLSLLGSTREYPSPMLFVERARKRSPNVWIDIEKPFWWDVPVWIASGKMNSIGLANNHMCRSQMLADEAWGKPRNLERLPNPKGNGYWTQEIYYHVLNAGLRIPPSAGSASGVLPNPVGYNRVYVHLNGPFTEKAWFDSLAQGCCSAVCQNILHFSARVLVT